MKVTISKVHAICYDETFKYIEIFFFWTRISLDLNYSHLAGTTLTVIMKCFNSEGQKVRYSSDYVIRPPGKSIQYK